MSARVLLGLILVALCPAMGATQQAARFAVPARPGIQVSLPLWPPDHSQAALGVRAARHSTPVLLAGSAQSRRWTVAGYTLTGALAGAAAGMAVLFASEDCRTPESMCGLGIPLYTGSGAAVGGLIGYVVGRIAQQ